jgi:hypothetical protein
MSASTRSPKMKASKPRAVKVEAPDSRWLIVKKISPGLFPSERAVEVETADGNMSFFVSAVKLDEAKNTLRVTVLDEDSRHVLVQLPSQGGGTVAKIERSGVR